jgi:hypothetical protein
MPEKYEVVDTREHTAMTPTGGTRIEYEVWIVTDKGVQGSARIAPSDWNREAIAEILDKKADELNLAFELD